jgi:hypothetical protein
MVPQLIKELDEITKQVPVNMTSDFDVIAPFLRTAEVTYVHRLIGKEQFDALVTAYDGDPSNEEDEAISLCQKVIANLGYYFAIPVLSVSVGSSGIQVFSNTDTKQAFQWQVNDLKDALQGLGFGAIEELLNYLEADPENFGPYSLSDQLQAQKTCLIRTAIDFNDHYEISNSRFVFQSITYIMKRVEQQTLAKQLGSTFLESLKGDELTQKQKMLVTLYLKPALALLTIGKAIIERVITLQSGVATYNFRGRAENNNETQAASNQQVEDMACQLNDDGDLYLQDGLQYINDNLADFEGFDPPMPRRRFKVTNNKHKGVWGN